MVYTLSYSDGAAVTATPVDGTIPACTPVLINAAAGNYEFATANTEVITYTFSTYNSGALNGVFKTGFVPAGSYVLQQGASGLGFYKVAADNSILVSPFRCWLTAEAAAPFLALSLDSTPTAIHTLEPAEAAAAAGCYYDLQGRKYAVGTALKPGIYIRNGRKLLMK